MDHDEDDLSVTGSGGKSETGSTTPGSRKQRVRESFNRMSGHVFRGGSARSCQDIYANRASSRLSFRLYALRFSWRICIRWIDSPSLSLSPPLSSLLSSSSLFPRSYALSIFTFYPRRIPASTRAYIHRARRVTHDNIGQFAYETCRYRLFQSSLFLRAPISRCRDERSSPPADGLLRGETAEAERAVRRNRSFAQK